jgi:hypothetical protein
LDLQADEIHSTTMTGVNSGWDSSAGWGSSPVIHRLELRVSQLSPRMTDCAGSIFDRISAVAMLTIVNVATAD